MLLNLHREIIQILLTYPLIILFKLKAYSNMSFVESIQKYNIELTCKDMNQTWKVIACVDLLITSTSYQLTFQTTNVLTL